MLLKMIVSPMVWLFMISSVIHSFSAARDKAAEIFYLASEIEPGEDDDEAEEDSA